MRKVLTLISLFLVVARVVADPVHPADAQRVANHFWQQVLHGQGSLHAVDWQYSEIYLFVGERHGFLLLSADDCARPVLAYSLDGTMEPDALSPALAERMEAYRSHIAAAVQQHAAATDPDARRWHMLRAALPSKDGGDGDRIDPLLQTRWHQDGGYALLTPQHTPTGCAATAQSQMMRYWNYPAFGYGSETYNCQPYGAQSADFAHTLYDWGNMPSQVLATSPYMEQLAVSTLMYHVGVSLHMGYAPEGSGAAGLTGQPGIPSIDNSLKDYFYYSHKMRPIFKANGYTDQQWADSLIAELRLRHPIIYCGVAPEGGHGFVCDGYEYRDGQPYFHFNFGWSGAGDGYYTTDDICPNVSPTGTVGTVYHFNLSNQALLGAVPDYKMHVSDTILTFDREGSSRTMLFSSIDTVSDPWSVQADQPWVVIETNGVQHAGEITVSAQPNTTGSERKATVTFSQNGETVTVQVVQTYYSVDDYCPLTLVMESTRGGGWEGGAYLSFESPSGYVYNTATLASGSQATESVGVAPHDVNIVFHHGGGTDRYINYRVYNQHGEELVSVDYAFMNGGTHFVEWPCAHVGISPDATEAGARPIVMSNPAHDHLRIAYNGQGQAQLFDALGRLQCQWELTGTGTADANLCPLPPAMHPGLYLLRTTTANGTFTNKIIIE